MDHSALTAGMHRLLTMGADRRRCALARQELDASPAGAARRRVGALVLRWIADND